VDAEVFGWRLRRSVPYSQVWPGSRGRERGRIHLELVADDQRRIGRLTRRPGDLLCGKRPWHSELARLDDDEPRCPRCGELAERNAIAWPTLEETLNASGTCAAARAWASSRVASTAGMSSAGAPPWTV